MFVKYLLGAASSAFALAAYANQCAETPPKHRIVVSYAGNTNVPDSVKAIEEADQNLARGAYHIMMVGGTEDRAGNFTPTPIPPEGKSKASKRSVIGADAKSIREQLPSLIAKDIAESGVKASDTEVEIIFGNHGKYVAGTEPKYSIVADPRKDPIEKADLEKLGASLPKGVRLKIVSVTCWGSDTQDYLLNAYTGLSKDNCACGVAAASMGNPAWVAHFENYAATLPAQQSTTLVDLPWYGTPRPDVEDVSLSFGMPPPLVKDEHEVTKNDYLSSSDRVMFRYFFKRLGVKHESEVRLKSLDLLIESLRSQKNSLTEVEKNMIERSYQLRKKAQLTEIEAQEIGQRPQSMMSLHEMHSYYSQKFMDKRQKSLARCPPSDRQDAELAALHRRMKNISDKISPIFEAAQKNKDNSLYQRPDIAVQLDELNRVSDQITAVQDDIYKECPAKDIPRYQHAAEAATVVEIRRYLDEAFLRMAPADVRREFLEFRKCELQRFGPGSEADEANLKGRSKGRQH